MIAYFDASALVKSYVEEEGSSDVRRWLADLRPATSRIAELEIASALARRCRRGELTPEDRDDALGAMGIDLSRTVVIELAPEVVAKAHVLLVRHALRAGDSIHLASCLELADRFDQPPRFLSYDRRLLAAAQAEGLETALD